MRNADEAWAREIAAHWRNGYGSRITARSFDALTMAITAALREARDEGAREMRQECAMIFSNLHNRKGESPRTIFLKIRGDILPEPEDPIFVPLSQEAQDACKPLDVATLVSGSAAPFAGSGEGRIA